MAASWRDPRLARRAIVAGVLNLAPKLQIIDDMTKKNMQVQLAILAIEIESQYKN